MTDLEKGIIRSERFIKSTDDGFKFLKPKIIWDSRTILFFLIRRDLLLSYRQTVLGIFWNILKPIVTTLIIVFVFKKVGQLPDYDLPYFLIAISGVIVWEFFSSSVNGGSICFTDDREIVTRVNFPRVLLPFVASLRTTIGFITNLLIILSALIFYKLPITVNFLVIPLIYLFIVLFNFGINLWLSTINVFYRDIQAVVPFILRIGLFVSPIGFSFQSIPEEWKFIYSFNPLVAIIESMRFCILGNTFLPDFYMLVTGFISITILIFTGIWFFAKNERKFADVI